jgi:hypothetical protein
MKTTLLIPAAALLLAIVFPMAAEQKDTSSESSEVRALREKVASLEAQVSELRKKVEVMEKRPVLTQALPAQPGTNAPANGIPRTFNGELYYIVPLEKGAAGR